MRDNIKEVVRGGKGYQSLEGQEEDTDRAVEAVSARNRVWTRCYENWCPIATILILIIVVFVIISTHNDSS